ncbi:hypothetical protein FNV43_RR00227 [Rhamnella rubrinervis]|uniref:Receptor-like serine/threonine-protein kinase n=1 Tax=Rhamnella rubrinervis TaxID=2594499 RepID=A0A8K0HQ68_9ROSA|nr:hypothetical protein FNV43_RR00227 [Rhamnella rubrinervis]
MNFAFGVPYILLQFMFLGFCTCLDTISITQPIRDSPDGDGDVLVSNGETFALGFFSPGKSNYRYVGIWYHKIPEKTVVWVANRDNPINDTSGFLSIDTQGNFVLFDNNDQTVPVWSTNSSALSTNGTGINKFLTSWESEDDPSEGNYTYRIDPAGYPQLMLYKGQVPWWRIGHWNGIRFNSGLVFRLEPIINNTFVNNDNEISFMSSMYNISILSRIVVDESGLVQRFILLDQERGWTRRQCPQRRVDQYGYCGAFGLCDYNNTSEFECTCLPGFEPKSYSEWKFRDATHGCVRKPGSLICSEAQYAKKSKGFVATKRFRAIMVVSGLLILFSIGVFAYWFAKRKRKRKSMIILFFWQRELFLDANITSEESPKEEKLEESRRYPDLPFFYIRTLISATDNFSATNMLGKGGFGSVYKGQLVNGQEIAVKRLSKHSGQGMQEFKNEVMVIAKLQHRNLVRLLGCCIHKEEKMLIYEYLPNKSLDQFIFDVTRRAHLDWSKRFEIICGITRGILYLHQDSRLKIIHRDLKASNVLLDASMNPKISDFGMAKMFGEDQIQANTNRIVGTYGYMSPEYAMQGLYSTKSDVFSFGVLLLEIISSRKITECINGSHFPNLIGHVWELWNDGRVFDIVDPALCQPFSTDEVSRCIHIGLLCVQEAATQRPTMSDVIFMLANETPLPPPNTPAFTFHYANSSNSSGAVSWNRISITALKAR